MRFNVWSRRKQKQKVGDDDACDTKVEKFKEVKTRSNQIQGVISKTVRGLKLLNGNFINNR